MPSAEEEYFQLMATAPAAWPEMGLGVDDFAEERHRRLFSLIQNQLSQTGQVSPPALHDLLPEEDKEWLMELTWEDKSFPEPLERKRQLIADIRTRRDNERLRNLARFVKENPSDLEALQQFNEMAQRIKGSVKPAGVRVERPS
jgi:hypothetical protein